MTDRELLELAARAAGIDLQHKAMFGGDAEPGYYERRSGKPEWVWWNPLQDDGDTMRLAVKLGIAIQLHPAWVYARAVPGHGLDWLDITEGWAHTKEPDAEPYAATRRAVVRAAAALATKETP